MPERKSKLSNRVKRKKGVNAFAECLRNSLKEFLKSKGVSRPRSLVNVFSSTWRKLRIPQSLRKGSFKRESIDILHQCLDAIHLDLKGGDYCQGLTGLDKRQMHVLFWELNSYGLIPYGMMPDAFRKNAANWFGRHHIVKR